MSGSPKAAEIRLRREQERQLQEERRRRAEEERRRREAAAQRAREQRMRMLRTSLKAESDKLRDAIRAVRRLPTPQLMPVGLPVSETDIDGTLDAMGSDPRSLARALAHIRAMAADVDSRRRLLRRHAEAQDRLQADIAREAHLEALRLSQARIDADTQREQAIISLVTRLSCRVAGLRSDEVTMEWSGREVEAVATEVDGIRALPEPEKAVHALHKRLDEALEHAQARQLAEERRAYIVAALQDGLRQQGFQVGTPSLIGGPSGEDVVFRAVRADQRRVDVNVPLEGHVFYEVDGTERVSELAADGQVYTSCDNTAARLEALHADIEQRFGVSAGELYWESKDPKRVQQTANDLPVGGPSKSKVRG